MAANLSTEIKKCCMGFDTQVIAEHCKQKLMPKRRTIAEKTKVKDAITDMTAAAC